MNPARFPSSLSLLLLALVPGAVGRPEWPGFRGANGSAVAGAEGLPVELAAQENLRWRVEVPFGRSSPILTEDAVVITASDAQGLLVMALDRADGGELWTRRLERAREQAIHRDNDSAAPTPATDGRNVYAFFPELGLVSLDAQGEERWRRPLGPFVNYYGMSSSPILARGTLVQLCDQQVGSFLVAVDAATGAERWRVERAGIVECFTTPLFYPADAPEQVVVSGSFFVVGYDLATGRERWRLDGFAYSPMPSPTLAGDTLFVCSPHPPEFPMPEFDALLELHDGDGSGDVSAAELSGSHLHFGWLDADKDGTLVRAEYDFARAGMRAEDHGMVAIDLAAEGGAPAELWRSKKGLPMIASPLHHDGVLYLARDGGLVTIFDAASGETLARERLPDAPGPAFASPVAADGKAFFVSNTGRVSVVDTGPEWTVLASTDLGEDVYATPAIGANAIFVRSAEALWCFGEAP